MRIAAGLRLGPLLCTPHQFTLCGGQVDASGTHGLHCRRSACRHLRHTALNNLVKTSLASIDIPVILEPPGLFRSDGKHVDGVTIVHWKSGRALAWDVTCSDIFAPTYVSLVSPGAGKVVNLAKTMQEEASVLRNRTYTPFHPHCHQASGAFGDEGFFQGIRVPP